MAENKCAICLAPLDDENAPILTISGHGMPRYLCENCVALVDRASGESDVAEINAAISALASKMSRSVNIDDRYTFDAVKEILESAKERADRISDGSWDFSAEKESLAAEDTDGAGELPPELCESEEDIILDKRDAESMHRFDKIMNWIYVALGVACAAFIIWFLFF